MHRKKVELNLIVLFSYQIIYIIYGLILPRLIIETYGANLHGLVVTIANLMGYVSLLQAGLSAVSTYSLYEPLARNDQQQLNRVLNTIRNFYKKSGKLYMMAVLALAILFPLSLKGAVSYKSAFALIAIIGIASAFECSFVNPNLDFLVASNHIYVSYGIMILILLIKIPAQLIFIRCNMPILSIYVMNFGLAIVTSLIQNYYLQCNYHFDKNIPSDHSLIKNRDSAVIHQIAGIIVYSTDSIVLSVFDTLSSVSIYSVYSMVITNLRTLMGSVFNKAFIGQFGQVIAEKDYAKLRRLFNDYEYVYYIVISIALSLTAILLLPFVELYTANVSYLEYGNTMLVILFVICNTLLMGRYPGDLLIDASGLFRETQGRAVTEALINFVVSLLLVKPLGIYGVLMGTIASSLYRLVDIVLFINKQILKQSCKTTACRMVRTLSIVIVSLWLGANLERFYICIDSWSVWFIHAVCFGILSVLMVFCVNAFLEWKTIKQVAIRYIQKRQGT